MRRTGNSNRVFLPVFIGLLALAALSCKKNQQADLNPNLNVANDIIIGERPVIYSFMMMVKAVTDTSLSQTHHAAIDHASVVYNPGQMRYTFYFFGFAGSDGVIRSGRFDASLNGDFFTTGTSTNIVFTDYSEDLMPVTGSDSLVCNGHNAGKVQFANRAVLSIRKDTVGTIRPYITLYYETPLYTPFGFGNSEIMITGIDSGTSSKGFSYLSGVTDTLGLRIKCPWISRGVIGFTVTGAERPAGTVIFISGTGCSNRVNYDLSGTVYEWKMQMNYLMH